MLTRTSTPYVSGALYPVKTQPRSPRVTDASPFGAQRTMVPEESLTGASAAPTSPLESGGGVTGANVAAYAGLAGLLGGSVMSYVGQEQGANAIQAESEKQLAEEQAFNDQRRQLFRDEVDRQSPQAGPALATNALMRAQHASRPAAAAGGKALGLTPGVGGDVNREIAPQQRVQANQTAGGLLSDRNRQALARLGLATSAIDDEQEMKRKLYDQRLGVAGQKGSAWRTGGALLSAGGAAGIGGAIGSAG